MEARPRFAGAVLTGGRSSRMGHDKALLDYDGVPMAVRVARALREAGADPVGAIGGDGGALEDLGLQWWPDLHPDTGPLGGLLTAFAAFVDAGLIAVAATDLPALEPAVVLALVDAAGSHDAAAARTDRLELLCAVWNPGRCGALLAAAFDRGERAVRRAIIGLDVFEVAVPARLLRNINTPDDLGR